jgi:hypothetical protein
MTSQTYGHFSLVITESGTDVMASYDVFLASGQKATVFS